MSNKYFQPVCYCGFSENQKQGQLKCPQTEGSLEKYSFGDSTPAMAAIALKNVIAPPRQPVESVGQFEEFFKKVQMKGSGDGSPPVESRGKAPVEDLGTLSHRS